MPSLSVSASHAPSSAGARSLLEEMSGPLAVITTLFFMWAIALNLNDILVPHLKKACSLSDLQSALIQTCYFGAYFLAALPAGSLMKRVGYKNGILAGLFLSAVGALLFYPASFSRQFSFFLFALFVMACGAAFLEVAANAYVVVLGHADTAEMRLNLVQSFNALGAAFASKVGKIFILSGIEHNPEQLAAMSQEQVDAYRSLEAGLVRMPYVVIGLVFFGIMALVHRARLPNIRDDETAGAGGGDRAGSGAAGGDRIGEERDLGVGGGGKEVGRVGEGARQVDGWEEMRNSVLRLCRGHPNFVRGVVAQFFYIGAQVGVCSFLIRYVQAAAPGMSEKEAAECLFYHLMLFLAGRIVGTMLMNKTKPTTLLVVFAVCCLALSVVCVLGAGLTALAAVVLLGFFNSIMFPTIFSLSVRGLGPLVKTASSLLIMSAIGGALTPAAMGLVSDMSGSIRTAFALLSLSYVVVLSFALRVPKENNGSTGSSSSSSSAGSQE